MLRDSLSASSASCLLLTLLFAQLVSCARGATTDAEFEGQNIISRNGLTYGVVNSTVIIPCRVQQLVEGSDNSNPTIAWFKGGDPLENIGNVSAVADNLVIITFTEDAVGDYTCTKTYDFGTITGNVIKLRSPEAYSIIFDDNTATFTVGNTLRLVCPIKSWTPAIAVQWFKDSEPISLDSDRVETLPGWLLHISNLTEEDSGEYFCSSKTVAGDYVTSLNSVNVSVISSAVADTYKILASPPEELNVILDEEAVLECLLNPIDGERTVWQVKVSTGSGHVEWRDVQSTHRILIQPNRYIKWKSADGSIDGEYRCKVVSSSGETLVTFPTRTSLVYAPTSTSNAYSEEEIPPASFVNFDCNIIGNPEPFISWYKDGALLDICHDKHVQGTVLTVERLTTQDAGLYQCMASNGYGFQSQLFKLSVTVKDGAQLPAMPVISSAKFLHASRVEVQWRTAVGVEPIHYYSLIFTRELCLPHVLTDSEVVSSSSGSCSECDGSGSICCRHTIEVHEPDENYLIQVTAFTLDGPMKSLPAIAVAGGDTITTDGISKTLDLQITDFGSVLLVQWMPVQEAAGYRVNVQQRSHHSQSLGHSDLRERSNDQLYDIILGPVEDSSLIVRVQAVTNPVEYGQTVDVNVTRPKFTDVPAAPVITIVGNDYEGGDRGVLVFWNKYPNVSYYHLWYKCDDREQLKNVSRSEQMWTIKVVDRDCTVVVAPVVGEEARPAGVARYERWCNYIGKPLHVTAAPHQSEDIAGYPMEISWAVSNESFVANCEINYLVRWKKAISDVFLERDSILVANRYSAIVEGLAPDFTYDFQVMAFTNVSDETALSSIVSYTVGPPLNPKNVAVAMTGFPQSPVTLSWSTGGSGHDIDLYTVVLYQWKGEEWKMLNSSAVEAKPGYALSVQYDSLLPDTQYKVNVSSINGQGMSGVSTLSFTTPPLVIPSTPALSTDAAFTSTTTYDSGDSVLSPIQIGVVIGLSLSAVVVIITALLCLLARKRFKNEELRLRQFRNQSTRLGSSSSYSCQQPLTIDTSHYEMATCLGDAIPQHKDLVNGDVKHCSPLPLSSPLHPSNQATSGQDSGIGGTAEDHRSSQDLEEYDDDVEGLINSSLSLNSGSSSSRPVFSQRWSGEHGYGFESQSKAARARTESECDSLLTDPRRVDMPLHDKLLNKCSHNCASGYHCLDSESSNETQTLTNCDSGV